MGIDPNIKLHFTRELLKWNREKNTRQMPWKGEKDPYKIWLSEIILQQTRVEQGLRYYQKFIKAFPDIHKLARAGDKKVFKLWEGLGYYTRCANLITTARAIAVERQGIFPATYGELLKLKGVGGYTAAAIASFAYNLPHAVADGNVFRLLARVFGITKEVNSAEGKALFLSLAAELLDKKRPAIYNQAIMDFGALVCRPMAPLCGQCIFKKFCKAFTGGTIEGLPLKKKKKKIKTRWFYYLVPEYKGKVFVRRRNGKDIWRNLYEFFLVETRSETPGAGILKIAEKKLLVQKKSYRVESNSPVFTQQLSHQKIKGQFIKIKFTRKPDLLGMEAVPEQHMQRYAFPKFINLYLQKHYR